MAISVILRPVLWKDYRNIIFNASVFLIFFNFRNINLSLLEISSLRIIECSSLQQVKTYFQVFKVINTHSFQK